MFENSVALKSKLMCAVLVQDPVLLFLSLAPVVVAVYVFLVCCTTQAV